MNDQGGLPGVPTSKRLKFVELAEKRTRNAVRAIQIIGKMGGNKTAYEYDERDVDRIELALRREVDAMRTLLLRGRPHGAEFTLTGGGNHLPRKG